MYLPRQSPLVNPHGNQRFREYHSGTASAHWMVAERVRDCPACLPWSNRGDLEGARPLGLPLHLDQKQNEGSLGVEPMLPSSVSQNPNKQTQLPLREFGKLLQLHFWNVRQRLMCSSQAHHFRSPLETQSSRLQSL